VCADNVGVRHVLRLTRLGSGPLRRGSDRVQALGRWLTALLVVAAIPIGVVVGLTVAGHLRAEATQQAADRHQLHARLLEDASTRQELTHGAPKTVAVRVAWTTPSGAVHEGEGTAPALAERGSSVRIWVDRAGDLASPPLGRAGVFWQALLIGGLSWLGVMGLAGLGYLLLCRLLDRHRLRRWSAEWAEVEPVWHRTVR
jgi:hypothetical protein